MKTKNLIAVLVLGAGMAASSAQSQTVLSDTVTFFNPFTGQPAVFTVPEDNASNPEQWLLIGQLPTGSLPEEAVRFIEPGSPGISDIIAAHNGILWFISDNGTPLSPLITLPDGTVVSTLHLDKITETGDPQDVSSFFFGPAAAGILIVQSDVEAAPEPGTYGVIAGAGLLALSLFRARKTLKTA